MYIYIPTGKKTLTVLILYEHFLISLIIFRERKVKMMNNFGDSKFSLNNVEDSDIRDAWKYFKQSIFIK